MYSPLTVAAEGGGVAVGGMGVAVGIWGVGVLELRKEAQALNPKAKSRIENRLMSILKIIPIKKVGHV
jgi:hypothetical protein